MKGYATSIAVVLAFVAAPSAVRLAGQEGGARLVKSTYLVVYRPGPAWLAGKPLAGQSLKEHGRYILDLYVKGALKSAGPFSDDRGGAAVFEAATHDEARAVVAADPAVVSGVFLAELHPWGLVDWESRVKK